MMGRVIDALVISVVVSVDGLVWVIRMGHLGHLLVQTLRVERDACGGSIPVFTDSQSHMSTYSGVYTFM